MSTSLTALVKRHGSILAAARSLNIPETTFRRRLAAESSPVAKARAAEPAELLAADRKVNDAKEDVRDLKSKLKASEDEVEELSKRLALVSAIEDGQGSRTTHISKYAPDDGQGIFVGVASDWHIGEMVDPATIAGYDNEYNPAIAKARAEKFFQSFVFMLDSWRHVGRCDIAVLAILGDIMTGYIHEELMEENSMSPSEEVLFAQELFGAGLEYILSNANLEKLIIPTCYGNHGRSTMKSRIQTGATNSFEYLLYKTLAREWRNESRIEWQIGTGYQVFTELYDTKVMWHHGDAVKFGGGVGGITIPLRKKIMGWNSGLRRPIDIAVNGHFHTSLEGPDFVSNGSLIGYNAFALSCGCQYEVPQQTCFWVDSTHGRTMTGRLYVQ